LTESREAVTAGKMVYAKKQGMHLHRDSIRIRIAKGTQITCLLYFADSPTLLDIILASILSRRNFFFVESPTLLDIILAIILSRSNCFTVGAMMKTTKNELKTHDLWLHDR